MPKHNDANSMRNSVRNLVMTDKIILQLTLDELKLIDKYVELNDETQSVFDKIKVAYPQPRMTLQQEGEYAVVSYQDKTYYRLGNKTTFSWWRQEKNRDMARPWVLIMISDAETERLLEGLYYNHIQVKKEKEQRTKTSVKEAYKDWWGDYPELETDSKYDDTRWAGFQAGYEFAYAISTAKEVMEKVQKEQEVEPSMTNCVITGNPPDGYVTWQEWYNELGSKGILHNLRISSIDYKPTPQEPEVREWDVIRESVKWCEKHPDKDPLDWLKPQTPEQVADGLKEAFREAVKQGVVSSVDKPKDDFMDRMVAELKGKTLMDLIYDWWEDIFTKNSDLDMENCIGRLVYWIEEWLPKEQSAAGSQNVYVECTVEGFNDCLTKIKQKLR